MALDREHTICPPRMSEDGGFFIIEMGTLISSLIISILIFTRYLYYQYTHRKDEDVSQISKTVRIIYVLLQMMTLMLLLNDIVRCAIDPFQHILSGTIFCDVVSFCARMNPSLVYFFYGWSMILRIKITFKRSALRLSKWKIGVLKAAMILVTISGLIGWPTLEQSSCVNVWEPFDVNTFPALNGKVMYCQVPWNKSSNALMSALVACAAITTTAFGMIFGRRLRKIYIIFGKTDEQLNRKTKLLITKNR